MSADDHDRCLQVRHLSDPTLSPTSARASVSTMACFVLDRVSEARSSRLPTGIRSPRQPLDHAPEKAQRLGLRLALLLGFGRLVPVVVGERPHWHGHGPGRAEERARVPFRSPALGSTHVAASRSAAIARGDPISTLLRVPPGRQAPNERRRRVQRRAHLSEVQAWAAPSDVAFEIDGVSEPIRDDRLAPSRDTMTTSRRFPSSRPRPKSGLITQRSGALRTGRLQPASRPSRFPLRGAGRRSRRHGRSRGMSPPVGIDLEKRIRSPPGENLMASRWSFPLPVASVVTVPLATSITRSS